MLSFLLCADEAVNEKIGRTIDHKKEVLDSCETEHPAGMGWKHSQTPAQVCPLAHRRL